MIIDSLIFLYGAALDARKKKEKEQQHLTHFFGIGGAIWRGLVSKRRRKIRARTSWFF
jgi:hypothetical protein